MVAGCACRDDDSRLGASSMQRFDGEDLSAGDRKKAQIEQAKVSSVTAVLNTCARVTAVVHTCTKA
jgi:hypothetical protein